MSDSFVNRRADEQSRIVGLLFVLVTAGCGGVKPAPPGEAPQSGTTQAGAEVVAPVGPAATTPSPQPPTGATQGEAAAVQPVDCPATPPTTACTSAVKAASPAAKAPAKVLASPAPAAQVLKKEPTTPDLAKQKAPPPLDLASLEQGLKDTNAIGVFTKIALKNQVDDLLNQFRAFYQGKLKTTLAELRRPYLLVLKVLSLLQDGDSSLAAAIVASREAIWGILSDPAKFATI